jgi:hypothetical protein
MISWINYQRQDSNKDHEEKINMLRDLKRADLEPKCIPSNPYMYHINMKSDVYDHKRCIEDLTCSQPFCRHFFNFEEIPFLIWIVIT